MVCDVVGIRTLANLFLHPSQLSHRLRGVVEYSNTHTDGTVHRPVRTEINFSENDQHQI